MPLASQGRFTSRVVLPVVRPYRLDLTVEVLRRLANNAVDVVDADGTYYRALSDDAGTTLVRARQLDPERVEIAFSGRAGERWAPLVGTMLGVSVDLSEWVRRSRRVGWVDRLARAFAGVKPPRYASAWESCAHAIVFAQISIHAAAAIMQRVIAAVAEPVQLGPIRAVPFPDPGRLLAAREGDLRAAGLSVNKVGYLRAAAQACADGRIAAEAIEAMPTAQAATVITGVRGLGPWSAAVVMLRGFGRIDTFPLRDSGVARGAAALSGDPSLDMDAVLAQLGPTRGMLYYHLLLGRLHPLPALHDHAARRRAPDQTRERRKDR